MSEITQDEKIALDIDEKYKFKLDALQKKFDIQYYNARFSSKTVTGLNVIKNTVREAHNLSSYGFSIQAFVDGGYGFSTANSISITQLEKSFEQAAKLAKWASKKAETKFDMEELDPLKKKVFTKQETNILDISQEEKLKYLLAQDKAALDYDPRVINTNSNYADVINHQILYTSDQREIEFLDAYVRTLIFAYSREENVLQSSRASMGITGGFEFVKKATNLGEEAARKAVEILQAKPVKGGKYNVILDPLLTGTFVHEAFGHASEADGVLAGESQLEGLIGKVVGPEYINIVDDPSIPGIYGSFEYDSEGVKAKKVDLVKGGILSGYLHSRETASKMNEEPTGNGRAQNFKSIPQVRMSTTYLDRGTWETDELFEDLKDGIYCENWQYGYVEPSVGQFQFKMERAWKIENGEKVQILRDAALSGTMLEVLHKIRGVGKDLLMDDGTCGKGGQGVPVSSGGPHILVDDVVIGGM